MKNLLLFCALLVIALPACQNSSDDNSPNPNSHSPPEGKWIVTYYYDKDKVETNNFSGYVFDFQSDGKLVATTSSGANTGSWSLDNSSNRFNISITGTDALEDTTDDWLILEKTDSSIKLKDDNDTHLEELYFQKQ